MQKIYWLTQNKTVSWEIFIDSNVATLSKTPLVYKQLPLYLSWKKCIGRSLFLLDALACICYVNRELADRVIEKLKNNEDKQN